MKKVLFVVALCVAVVFANAQEKKTVEKKEVKTTTVKTEKTVQTPAKVKIAEADLMQPIKDNIAKDFAGAKVEKAFKHDVKGLVTYEVVIMKDNAKWSLVYDKDGKFLKKEEMKKMEMKKTEKKVEAPKQ